MGIGNIFKSWKEKAQDATMDKVLERMRDLKQPIAEKKINEMIKTHVLTLPGIKSASVDVSREGLDIKVSFSDDRPTVKRRLKFVELVWTSHKRAFVFELVVPVSMLASLHSAQYVARGTLYADGGTGDGALQTPFELTGPVPALAAR